MTLTTYHMKDLAESLERAFLKVERSKLCPFCTLEHFLKNRSVAFSLTLTFGMDLPWDGTINQLPKAGFDCIALKVIFQGQKGQVWHIFTYMYFSILISSIEVLPKCIAEVILVLFSSAVFKF